MDKLTQPKQKRCRHRPGPRAIAFSSLSPKPRSGFTPKTPVRGYGPSYAAMRQGRTLSLYL